MCIIAAFNNEMAAERSGNTGLDVYCRLIIYSDISFSIYAADISKPNVEGFKRIEKTGKFYITDQPVEEKNWSL
ncbi:MAG: hypothetical protein WDZ47_03210, partial [Bacteroidales bacterium]